LKDYQENLKFKYLFSLAESASQRLSQAVTEQLQAYSSDFGALADRLSSKQEDKERAAAVLADMNARCRRLEDDLGRLKQDVSVASSGG
jgi:chromosome segregation ATPase